jgi:hypothetical protein
MDIATQHGGPRQPDRLHVLLQNLGSTSLTFNEQDRTCAATEGLQAQGSRAGEEIEYSQTCPLATGSV